MIQFAYPVSKEIEMFVAEEMATNIHLMRLTAGHLASTKVDYFSELIIYIS